MPQFVFLEEHSGGQSQGPKKPASPASGGWGKGIGKEPCRSSSRECSQAAHMEHKSGVWTAKTLDTLRTEWLRTANAPGGKIQDPIPDPPRGSGRRDCHCTCGDLHRFGVGKCARQKRDAQPEHDPLLADSHRPGTQNLGSGARTDRSHAEIHVQSGMEYRPRGAGTGSGHRC